MARAHDDGPRSLLTVLHVLQFEVAVSRRDPNASVLLSRAADADGMTAEHLSWLGCVCVERRCSNPELGRLAFGKALERLRAHDAPRALPAESLAALRRDACELFELRRTG